MHTYDSPLFQTIPAHADASVSTAADVFQLASPSPGMKGRVLGISIVTTTATTVAAAELLLGTVADPDAYGTIAIPITAIDTQIALTKVQIAAILELPADTVLLLSGDGAATAGALDIALTIGWYN